MKLEKVVGFPVADEELDALALKIVPLPKDILPSPTFVLQTRNVLLGLTRTNGAKAA